MQRFWLLGICFLLGTLMIAPATESDGVFSFLVAPAGPANHRNSEGEILELPHGELLLAWTAFYSEGGSDWSPSRIALMISRDQGRSWSDKQVLQPNIGKMNVMEADLLHLRSGKVLFIFLRKNSESDCVPMVRLSSDGFTEFSQPRMIQVKPNPGYYVINNDRIIQLHSGRILVPLAFTRDYRRNQHFVTRVLYSDDEGDSWKEGDTAIDVQESRVGAEEPGVVELKDERVMLWIRTSTGHPYQSYSSDGGSTWSPVRPMDIVSPDSPQSIKRVPATGDLLLVWNNSIDHRSPLTTAISKDDGQSWQHFKNIEVDSTQSYAYTSIAFFGDRVLFTYYVGPAVGTHSTGSLWSLKLTSAPIRWFYQ